ncbi:MAG: serine protease, partial [Sphingobacteriales bacterium]
MELNQQLVTAVEALIIEDRFEEALKLLKDKFSKLSSKVETTIIQNLAQCNSLREKIANGEISQTDANVRTAQISNNILYLVQKKIPETIETNRIMGTLAQQELYRIEDNHALEKIIGKKDNLLKINWLLKGIEAAKSVCQVVRADGEKGTGFLVEGGFVITNFHVIPTKAKADSSRIVFDYEEDITGSLKTTTEYELDSCVFIFSPLTKLDYSYIKVKDKPEHPIANWGCLKLDDFSEPQIDDSVVIIQHALGQTKQIALNSNTIIGIDSNKIYYTT